MRRMPPLPTETHTLPLSDEDWGRVYLLLYMNPRASTSALRSSIAMHLFRRGWKKDGYRIIHSDGRTIDLREDA